MRPADAGEESPLRVSGELIPKGDAELIADAITMRSVLPEANTFNIPDLLRFPTLSWEACKRTKEIFIASDTHIRAIEGKGSTHADAKSRKRN